MNKKFSFFHFLYFLFSCTNLTHEHDFCSRNHHHFFFFLIRVKDELVKENLSAIRFASDSKKLFSFCLSSSFILILNFCCRSKLIFLKKFSYNILTKIFSDYSIKFQVSNEFLLFAEMKIRIPFPYS